MAAVDGRKNPPVYSTTRLPAVNPPTGEVGNDRDGAWKIAVGVTIPIVIIVTIGVVIYILYRRKYPVRMILGREFAKFRNPNYERPRSTATLVRDDADVYFNAAMMSAAVNLNELNPVNPVLQVGHDNLAFQHDNSGIEGIFNDEDTEEREFRKKKSWLFKRHTSEEDLHIVNETGEKIKSDGNEDGDHYEKKCNDRHSGSNDFSVEALMIGQVPSLIPKRKQNRDESDSSEEGTGTRGQESDIRGDSKTSELVPRDKENAVLFSHNLPSANKKQERISRELAIENIRSRSVSLPDQSNSQRDRSYSVDLLKSARSSLEIEDSSKRHNELLFQTSNVKQQLVSASVVEAVLRYGSSYNSSMSSIHTEIRDHAMSLSSVNSNPHLVTDLDESSTDGNAENADGTAYEIYTQSQKAYLIGMDQNDSAPKTAMAEKQKMESGSLDDIRNQNMALEHSEEVDEGDEDEILYENFILKTVKEVPENRFRPTDFIAITSQYRLESMHIEYNTEEIAKDTNNVNEPRENYGGIVHEESNDDQEVPVYENLTTIEKKSISSTNDSNNEKSGKSNVYNVATQECFEDICDSTDDITERITIIVDVPNEDKNNLADISPSEDCNQLDEWTNAGNALNMNQMQLDRQNTIHLKNYIEVSLASSYHCNLAGDNIHDISCCSYESNENNTEIEKGNAEEEPIAGNDASPVFTSISLTSGQESKCSQEVDVIVHYNVNPKMDTNLKRQGGILPDIDNCDACMMTDIEEITFKGDNDSKVLVDDGENSTTSIPDEFSTIDEDSSSELDAILQLEAFPKSQINRDQAESLDVDKMVAVDSEKSMFIWEMVSLGAADSGQSGDSIGDAVIVDPNLRDPLQEASNQPQSDEDVSKLDMSEHKQIRIVPDIHFSDDFSDKSDDLGDNVDKSHNHHSDERHDHQFTLEGDMDSVLIADVHDQGEINLVIEHSMDDNNLVSLLDKPSTIRFENANDDIDV